MPNKTIQGSRALAALCVAAVAAVMLPRLAGVGMFVDGLTYATLARNLAAAPAPNLWHLHYTDTLHSQFYEHPPGAIWLQAATFKAVGDVPWAESLHAGLLTAAFFAALVALWRAARPNPQVGAWLPAALALAFPLTSWVFSNGMLEGPLTVACLLAAAATLRGWASRTAPRAAAWGAAAGAVTLAGVLVKGPFALFLLVLPALVPWIRPNTPTRQSEWTTAGMAAALMAGAAALFVAPAAHDYLARYGQQQIWDSLRGGREVATSRLTALNRLFSELAVPTLLGLGMHAAVRRLRRQPLAQPAVLPARGWGVLGLSASLPVLLSPKQSGWYIYQSLPFFALALACWMGPAAVWVQQRAAGQRRSLHALAAVMLLLSAGLAGLRCGQVDKHADFHRDFTQQAMAPQPGAQFTVCPLDLLHDWSLHANVARSLQASLTGRPGPWLLVDGQSHAPCPVPPTCLPVHPPQPQRYHLYHCETSQSGPNQS